MKTKTLHNFRLSRPMVIVFAAAVLVSPSAHAMEGLLNNGLEAGGRFWDLCGGNIDRFLGEILPWSTAGDVEEDRGYFEITPSVEWKKDEGVSFQNEVSVDMPLPVLSRKFRVLIENVSNFDRPLESGTGRTRRDAGLQEDEEWTGGVHRKGERFDFLEYVVNPAVRLEDGFGVRLDAGVKQNAKIGSVRVQSRQTLRFDSMDGWFMRLGVSADKDLTDRIKLSTDHGAVWHDEDQSWEFAHHIGARFIINPKWALVGGVNGSWGKGGDEDRDNRLLSVHTKLSRTYCEGRLTLFAQGGADFREEDAYEAVPFVRAGVEIRFSRTK